MSTEFVVCYYPYNFFCNLNRLDAFIPQANIPYVKCDAIRLLYNVFKM